MRVLVACEESQRVTIELRKIGIDAFSCDILDQSGGYPEWHIKGDVLSVINQEWDMIIAFPPCTYLTVTGNRWMKDNPDREQKRIIAIDFFLKIANAECKMIAIENPVGIMSSVFRRPNQIIQPWMFGDNTVKTTCLWTKGLPLLVPEINTKPEIEYFEWVDSKGRSKRQSLWYYKTRCLPHSERARVASKTFPGIAKAMATQWGNFLISGNDINRELILNNQLELF